MLDNSTYLLSQRHFIANPILCNVCCLQIPLPFKIKGRERNQGHLMCLVNLFFQYCVYYLLDFVVNGVWIGLLQNALSNFSGLVFDGQVIE